MIDDSGRTLTHPFILEHAIIPILLLQFGEESVTLGIEFPALRMRAPSIEVVTKVMLKNPNIPVAEDASEECAIF
jgi:hypothetical protein